MLRNYLIIAWRSLVKHKIYALINICGLAASMAACICIALYVDNELSYDKFNPNADLIYKLVLERKYPNHTTLYSPVPSSFAEVAMTDFPEVRNVLRFTGPWDEGTFSYKPISADVRQIHNTFLIQADSSFFSFFEAPFLQGNPKTALAGPNQIVITEEFARKMFGEEDPMNKIIDGGNFGDYKVTGVCMSLPTNSHIKFDVVGSLSTDPFFTRKGNNFTAFNTHTYFELDPGADPRKLESRFPKMVDLYASGEIERELKMSWSDYTKAGNGYHYFLQPLTSIHLDPRPFELTFLPGGNLVYVYALIFIAVTVVVVTCINYINLATARSMDRAREVGVRKVVGSSKQQLMLQFLTESILLSLIAMALAIVLVILVLPQFFTLINQQLDIQVFPGLFWVAGGAIVIAVLAGIYPAFVLSNHKPTSVLKGNFVGSSQGLWLRNSLVVFQFVVSTVLIASTTTVVQQINFVRSKDIGFDKEQVLLIDQAYGLKENRRSFGAFIAGLKGVRSVGGVGAYLGGRFWESMRLQPESSSDVLTVKFMLMNDDFSNTIGFTFTEGRSFTSQFNDSSSIILNETAVRTLNLKNPIGQKLVNSSANDDGTLSVTQYTIVGVVKDFNFQPLHDQITPLAIVSSDAYDGFFPSFAVRLNGTDIQGTLHEIESKWNELAPGKVFRGSFLDQQMDRQYNEEQRSGKLFAIFATLSILIGCVGIFGLALYASYSRTKELSIRKVLGASIANLAMLLTANFAKLVAVSIIIAIPFSWWMMNNWLNGFAYRVEVEWWTLFASGGIAAIIPLGIVIYQAIKMALGSPIRAIRND